MTYEAFKYCEEVIKCHSASFYKAFSKLPRQKANAIYAVYAFCRMCDDLIDEARDFEGLKRLESDLRRFEQGDLPNGYVWIALQEVFQTFNMQIQPFFDQVKGQYKDAHFTPPETQGELEAYCYFVASSVGLMILPILATKKYHELKQVAIKLGLAMQLTNILRDVGEDIDRGRVYLPEEVLDRFGYTKEALLGRRICSSFVDVWEYEASCAENYYLQVRKDIKKFDLDSRLAVMTALRFYRGILNEVRKNNYDCFTKRAFVNNRRKVMLLAKSIREAYL